ncbi:MAG: hypothetical protein E6Q93_23760 [Burkholderiaceae bacterium]|nr:MAG: hypothetical protein E6Q93_23760 [Burkholderiaceae bacterium]
MLLDIAQAVLLGFAQSGGFRVDVEFLQSDFYTSMQSVNFVTEVGAQGQVVVSLVHAPTTSFKHMLAGALQVVGLAMTVIELAGVASCAVTGGAGCAVAGTAGGVGALSDLVSAGITCTDGASSSCAWSAGVAAGSLVTFGAGEALEAYLKNAGLFHGGIADAYRLGDVYTTTGVSVFDVVGFGVVEQHDEDLGVHAYSVIL